MFIKDLEKNALLKSLQTVIGIVERKQPLPILSNVLIEKSDTAFFSRSLINIFIYIL